MRRPHFLLFGLAAYAAAVASMGYFALFLAGLGVPKTVDSGTPMPFGETLAIDLSLVLLFGVTHSLLARRWVKSKIVRLLPAALERALYVLVASAEIALLCWAFAPLPESVWSLSADWPRLAAGLWLLQASGWGVTLLALSAIGSGHLFGLRQAVAASRELPYLEPPLEERGPYRFVRHPIYAGTLVAFWSTPEMSEGRLLLVAGLSIYLFIGLAFEERDLETAHGEAYRERRRRLPGWLPFRLQ